MNGQDRLTASECRYRNHIKSGKEPKAPVPTESVEQQCLFRWANFQSGKYPGLELMYHIPNEGKRSRSTGARLKAEGLKPGVPDICLPVPMGIYHGLYIELKRLRGNITTENQDKWLDALAMQGYKTAVCFGWEEASQVIMEYLGGNENV